MGEAKRRKALEFEITQQTFPKDSADQLTASVLQNIADILDCGIFLKEPGDDLLNWPIDSIIGHTTEITKARGCPFIKDIREKLFPRIHWEFLITDAFLCGAYVTDCMKRGLEFPGPINPPENVAAHARKWFKSAPPIPGGWKGVVPTATAIMATLTPKDMRAN